jgi:hypothetical protein
MEYNIEKINEIGKMLAEIIGEAMMQRGEEQVRIGDVEMALRETLKAAGQSGLKQFLENADRELGTEMECACGGKLQYQRRRFGVCSARLFTRERIMQAVLVKRVNLQWMSNTGSKRGG